jgi:hypothetical protein
MRKKGSLFIAIFFLLLGIFGVVESLTFHYWESTVLPLAVSCIISIFAAIEVGKEIRRRDKREGTIEKKGGEENQDGLEMRRFGLAFGWVAGFSLAIALFGFYIAIPVFTLAYLKWRGRSWLAAAVFAVAMVAFIYGTFELGLKAPLFGGLIFGGR